MEYVSYLILVQCKVIVEEGVRSTGSYYGVSSSVF